MAANNFTLPNASPINSMAEFLISEKNNTFSNIIYYPDEMDKIDSKNIKFTEKKFEKVSLSKTELKNVKFFNCEFVDCLFLNTTFTNCTFSNCTFRGCNTSGSKWEGETSIDPLVFKKNFNFKDDANIAIKLFIELQELYIKNHQIDREQDARYLYLKSSRNLIHYHYKNKDIPWYSYYSKRFISFLYNLSSGYGVYKKRILSTLIVYLFIISYINYEVQSYLFDFTGKDFCSYSFIETLYFSFITITTIGYGDISPSTETGQMVIMIESIIGISLITLSLNIFTSEK